ncbi:hypothetical protein TSA66_05750 [Noviherbaspirillum autotrophicum]|uniref:Uncharacterized protein n=1 Tax=Noviherbaspirillum autotrophicum TaxID=709839 RepID=A0A0C2BGS8_9BURK|nr:hypothetical protein TSA66_05750 [Noviherbaspirillum autotrophicum]
MALGYLRHGQVAEVVSHYEFEFAGARPDDALKHPGGLVLLITDAGRWAGWLCGRKMSPTAAN